MEWKEQFQNDAGSCWLSAPNLLFCGLLSSTGTGSWETTPLVLLCLKAVIRFCPGSHSFETGRWAEGRSSVFSSSLLLALAVAAVGDCGWPWAPKAFVTGPGTSARVRLGASLWEAVVAATVVAGVAWSWVCRTHEILGPLLLQPSPLMKPVPYIKHVLSKALEWFLFSWLHSNWYNTRHYSHTFYNIKNYGTIVHIYTHVVL